MYARHYCVIFQNFSLMQLKYMVQRCSKAQILLSKNCADNVLVVSKFASIYKVP